MFTGIVTGIGQITAAEPLGGNASYGKRLTLQAPPGYLDDAQAGDSIALNGACMTLTAFDAAAGRSRSTYRPRAWTRRRARPAGPVNLEKALRANDRLGGHRSAVMWTASAA